LATQLFAFRAFVFASLDPTVARTPGVPVRALDAVLFGSIAVMTGLVTRALGALPTFALTVLPAIGALRLKIGLGCVFAVASLLGATAGAGGYGIAYWLDWSVGASQTLVAAALMLATRGVGSLTNMTD
jgi:zinc transport system permease protein